MLGRLLVAFTNYTCYGSDLVCTQPFYAHTKEPRLTLARFAKGYTQGRLAFRGPGIRLYHAHIGLVCVCDISLIVNTCTSAVLEVYSQYEGTTCGRLP